MAEVPANFLCCDLSEEANEPLYGTAVSAAVWFILEYTRPWGAKATSENELPHGVQVWLEEQVEKHNGRLQFIRQFRPEQATISFFICSAGRLYRFDLSGYEDLLGLDVTAVLQEEVQYDSHLVEEKHYFVCTNGKRDRSCAVRGAATYRAFADQAGATVWMTTHLGGHRFAPTLLSLPDGFCYGRIHPQDVAQFVEYGQQNAIWLEKLRGQSRYTAVEQAADYFLRQETGRIEESAFELIDCLVGNGRWRVQFRDQDENIYHVSMATARPLDMLVNSGSTQTKSITQFMLEAITEETS